MNTEMYKEYISDNIKNNDDHNHIINIIKQHKCNYTENKNGFYVDLNNMNDNILEEIYNIIKSKQKNIHHKNSNDGIINTIKHEIQQLDKKPTIYETSINKDIYIHEFNESDKEIINFIKQI